jgi:hypothetical protein
MIFILGVCILLHVWDLIILIQFKHYLISNNFLAVILSSHDISIQIRTEHIMFNSWWGHWIFHSTSFFQPYYGPGVNPASNRNVYQESSRWKGQPAHKVNNLPTIYELIFWEKNVGAFTSYNPTSSMAFHRDSLLTNYMGMSPSWEAASFAATQRIS